MQRNKYIAARLQEVLIDGYLIANTNYKSQIQNLSYDHAYYKIGTLHSIAELIFHINYYLEGLLRAFETGSLDISDKFSFDLSPETSAASWQNLIGQFHSNSRKFVQYIEQMDDQLLDLDFIDPKYGTYLRNIEGVIEHAYYHLGQISLIRKLLNV